MSHYSIALQKAINVAQVQAKAYNYNLDLTDIWRQIHVIELEEEKRRLSLSRFDQPFAPLNIASIPENGVI